MAFDDITTTISVSMGLKNKIRSEKGALTYEEYLTRLLERPEERLPENRAELTEYTRKSIVAEKDGLRIHAKYNELIPSPSHRFDIQIVRALKDGKQAALQEETENVRRGYELYFELLQKIISKEKGMRFTHRGRIEDAERWKEEFRRAGLSRTAYEEDVADRLKDYEQGISLA